MPGLRHQSDLSPVDQRENHGRGTVILEGSDRLHRCLDVLCLAMNLIEKLFGTWVLLFWLPIVVLAVGIPEWTAAFRRVWAGQSD